MAGRQQQIALDKMPVISLSQRAPVAGPLYSQGILSVSNGGEDDVGGGATGKNYRKVVPRPDDEPSEFCVVSKTWIFFKRAIKVLNDINIDELLIYWLTFCFITAFGELNKLHYGTLWLVFDDAFKIL